MQPTRRNFRCGRTTLAALCAISLGSACASNRAQQTSPGSVQWGVPLARYVPPPSDAKPAIPEAAQESGVNQGRRSVSPANFPPAFVTASQKLAQHVVEHPRFAWERLAWMCDTFGPRLSGSKALEDAIDWAVKTLQDDGFETARREKVMVPHWVRGNESAKVIAPFERDLVMLGLGNSVGTSRRGIRAEVIVVGNMDQLNAMGGLGRLKDKIVLINQAMPPYDHEEHDAHYGDTVVIRSSGPSAAAKHGAKAVLVRSVTAYSLRTPHTGALRYTEEDPKIPAAALTPADADMVERLASRGPVTIELKMDAKMHKDAPSANVVAELKGREKPEEIVVIGGHIDSWDVGQGAHDDGAGVLMAMDALRMLKAIGLTPRRTIRAVLFTNEENGLRGAQAYFDAHKEEVHVAAIEADSGSGAPQALGISGTPEQVGALFDYEGLFAPFGVSALREGGGGADIGPLM